MVKTTGKKPTSIGSSFDGFLDGQGTLAETTNQATKRVLAFQLRQAMETERMTKTELSKRMQTSRSQVDRVLDPKNDGVTLEALVKAAAAVGRTLTIELR